MYNIGFRGSAESNVENYPTFRQTLQLPSSGLICNGWAFLEAYIGQAVNRKLDLMVHHHIQPKDGNCNVCRNVG
jgi:hypothetical protein